MSVAIYPTRVDVLDAAGSVLVTHPVPNRPTRLPPDWGPPAPPSQAPSRTALEDRFLARFPQAAPFLEGLKRSMMTLTPIHLRTIDRLADLYGDPAMRAALQRARDYRNFNAEALKRILEAVHPNLTTIARRLPELLAGAEQGHPAYSEFLREVLRAEQTVRWERKIQRRTRWSKLGPEVPLDGFDWSARPQLSPQVVKELLTFRFVEERRNVILVGKPSTGKMTVARAIGHAACRRGMSVYGGDAGRRPGEAPGDRRGHDPAVHRQVIPRPLGHPRRPARRRVAPLDSPTVRPRKSASSGIRVGN